MFRTWLIIRTGFSPAGTPTFDLFRETGKERKHVIVRAVQEGIWEHILNEGRPGDSVILVKAGLPNEEMAWEDFKVFAEERLTARDG